MSRGSFALFVDAGYVLADGAMAVHGTRHRDSVTWDYSGLLKFLSGLSRDRSGLPVLRCYWYEAAAEAAGQPSTTRLPTCRASSCGSAGCGPAAAMASSPRCTAT